FFSSRRRHTRSKRDWSSDVCSSDLKPRQKTLLISMSTLIKLVNHEKIPQCLLNQTNVVFLVAHMNDSIIGRQYIYSILDKRPRIDRKSTRLNSSHVSTSYAVFCLKK